MDFLDEKHLDGIPRGLVQRGFEKGICVNDFNNIASMFNCTRNCVYGEFRI